MKKIWNLTKSDIFSLWKSSRFLFILILLYEAAYCIGGNKVSFLGVLAVVFGGMFSYNSISYDEKNGWNRFILTTAYSRRDYVLGKYLLSFVGMLAGTGLVVIADHVANALGSIETQEMLSPVLPMVAAATLFMASIALPLSFYFGVEKARMISLLTVALICGTAGGAVVLADGHTWDGNFWLPNLILIALGIVIFCLSAFLSVKIYSRRQL